MCDSVGEGNMGDPVSDACCSSRAQPMRKTGPLGPGRACFATSTNEASDVKDPQRCRDFRTTGDQRIAVGLASGRERVHRNCRDWQGERQSLPSLVRQQVYQRALVIHTGSGQFSNRIAGVSPKGSRLLETERQSYGNSRRISKQHRRSLL